MRMSDERGSVTVVAVGALVLALVLVTGVTAMAVVYALWVVGLI